MHHTLNRCARPVAAALAMLLGMAVAAPPTLASEPAATPPTQVSLSATAAAHVAALDAGALAAAQAAPAAAESQSFFKSRKVVLAAVLFAAGVTFTYVSKSRDRVKSPIRN